MAACADEADEPVLGAERTGKGYLEQTMERGKTQRLAEMAAANSDVPMMKNVAKTIGKRLYGILNAMRHAPWRIKRKCGSTEQQDQAAENKSQGLPQPGAL